MPGFIGALFKTIVDEAEKRAKNLSRPVITKMVTETLAGTGKLVTQNGMDFDALVRRVATRGGITEEGVRVIQARFPQVMQEVFERTAGKRGKK
jgi:pyrroline-5-carboxylate reductase